MRRWAWAAVVVLLGPQLVLLGGVGARREAQRTQQPGQRADPPNATASASSREGLPEAPKPSQASGPEFSDAHMTWLNFVRRPDDGALRKRCGSRDKKPRDLFGPPGPPGAEVTTETLLHEFQELLKEAKERRFSGLLDLLLPQGAGLQLVGEAFHCRLQGPRRVDKRTLVELHGFQAVSGAGSLERGVGWGPTGKTGPHTPPDTHGAARGLGVGGGAWRARGCLGSGLGGPGGPDHTLCPDGAWVPGSREAGRPSWVWTRGSVLLVPTVSMRVPGDLLRVRGCRLQAPSPGGVCRVGARPCAGRSPAAPHSLLPKVPSCEAPV
nr:adipolin isoform X1 [Gorilla gorilla gorilla]